MELRATRESSQMLKQGFELCFARAGGGGLGAEQKHYLRRG